MIALISGGKDSLYSIVHCIRNGHRVVALANLYPPPPSHPSSPSSTTGTKTRDHEYENEHENGNQNQNQEQEEQDDIDSFMYQTIGHGVIPLYESALGIPLYRAPILGRAVDTGRVYGDHGHGHHQDSTGEKLQQQQQQQSSPIIPEKDGNEDEDETESLIPLLKRIKQAHPEANAISAGAILSTYQRTRIENVAARLGLVPLAWLWMYPFLPPPEERKDAGPDLNDAGLLEDMAACGCEARIIKVASGGLDNGFLWEDVSSSDPLVRVRQRMIKAMRRFVGIDDLRGAVLGEGGEYETLAFDGPGFLWKKRIEIDVSGREERSAEGGVGYLRLKGASCVDKNGKDEGGRGRPEEVVRRPFLLDDAFESVLGRLSYEDYGREGESISTGHTTRSDCKIESTQLTSTGIWTISNITASEAGPGAGDQMHAIARKVEQILKNSDRCRSTDDIVFATVLLRSMADFILVNSVYVSLFKKPNPPARVAIGCGNTLPEGVNVMVSFVVDLGPRASREGLHVQSRSYWAPANIGPYSQAISIPLLDPENTDSSTSRLVYIAGQIPLEPASMEIVVPDRQHSWFEGYSLRAVLSLQHLWRVGTAMQVDWWVGAVAFLIGNTDDEHDDGGHDMDTKARVAWHIWEKMHTPIQPDEDEEEDEPVLDAWDIKYGGRADEAVSRTRQPSLPNFDIVRSSHGSRSAAAAAIPPFFAVQIDQLPRGSDIEWQGLGTRCKQVKMEMVKSLDNYTTHTRVDESTFFTGIEIDIRHSGPEFEACIRDILAECIAQGQAVSQAVLYTSQPLPEGLCWPGQIVPCKFVWGGDGRRLIAGIFLQRA